MADSSPTTDSSSILSVLAQKKWFGFDLDDTLHEFRKASAQASQSVFESIHSRSGVEIASLKSSYSDILRTATSNAFTDGRTSIDYRRDRFTSLLKAHELLVDESDLGEDQYISQLLNIYQSSLSSNLALKKGALPLLRALKQRGKKIIVVTEGPADAQEWTIQNLGLKPYVDILVTTNEAGCSKVDGLFKLVLEKYNIRAGEILYFGDNFIRDIQASQKEGILAILYHENEESQLTELGTLQINSWEVLKDILEGEG